MNSFRTGLCLVVAFGLGTAPHSANAFTHVVVQGDTLASIAEKYYGKIQYENSWSTRTCSAWRAARRS